MGLPFKKFSYMRHSGVSKSIQGALNKTTNTT